MPRGEPPPEPPRWLMDASVLAGNEQLRQGWSAARNDAYEEIVDRCEDFQQQLAKEYEANHFTYAELEENEVDLVKLKGWLDRIHSRDVLGAEKLDKTIEAVAECEQALEAYAARV